MNVQLPKSEPERKEEATIPTASRYFGSTIIEMLYRPEDRITAFAVWREGRCAIEARFTSSRGERFVPFSPANNLIKNEAVLLPAEPQEYGSEEELIADVKSFIRRYTDLSSAFEKVATYYVILTWLYDAFNELPYLRLRGDFGTGKTRALLTIGSLCYKAFFASGASTVSPIFHTLNMFRGTLILDEADFRFSDERAEIVKILNNGNVRGLPVLRTMMTRQREFNPEAFHVFGPKLVATRGRYDDRGLESRFITEEMGSRPLRSDIPINLPPSFKAEARALRNRLLLFRFRNRANVRLNEQLAEPKLEPRLNQIFMPLLSVVGDGGVRAELAAVALDAQQQLVAERGMSAEARVLEILAGLAASATRPVIPVSAVAAGLIERHGSEYGRPITSRWVGNILRRRLNLRTYKSNGVFVVPLTERGTIALLCQRFGINTEP